MKTFECSDIMPACDWKTQGNSEDEVVQNAVKHAADKHPDVKMTDEIKQKVRSLIHDIKAA